MKKIILSCLFISLITCVFSQIHTLPALRFKYNAYEPFIDSQTMLIHHSKHHQGYVDKLNKAIEGTKAEKLSLEELNLSISAFNSAVRNNAGGHYNHTLFWEILTPKNTSSISKSLELAINSNFKTLDALKTELNNAAATRFGSGWAWLIVTPDGNLKVTSTANQDNPLMDITEENGIPIIAIDVWEHAYYLKYQNKRGDYLGSIWSLMDWGVISAKYEDALKSSTLETLKKYNWKSLTQFKSSYISLKNDTQNSATFKTNAAQFIQATHFLSASETPSNFDASKTNPIIIQLDEQACTLTQILANPKRETELSGVLNRISQLVEQLQIATK